MIDRRPLHEPYENRTAKQPNDFGEIIDNQTALRAVAPLIPPGPSPPAKALGAKGGQAIVRVRYWRMLVSVSSWGVGSDGF